MPKQPKHKHRFTKRIRPTRKSLESGGAAWFKCRCGIICCVPGRD